MSDSRVTLGLFMLYNLDPLRDEEVEHCLNR